MAIKVPIYENQVQPQQAPGLSIPAPASPPPSAFGTELAARVEQTGNVVSGLGATLAEHAIERSRQAQQAQLIDTDTKFRQDLQNTMFSTDPDDNGVPKGVFNRQLGQAAGATQDFDKQYGELRQKYMSQLTNPIQQNEMARLMDENYTHHRQLVIHHEATQSRENEKNIVDGNLSQMVNDAGNLADPAAFMKQVQLGHDRQFANMKENGYDDGSIATATDKFSSDMAKSAITPLIGPSPAVAMDYLEKISPVLTPGTKASLAKMIDVGSRQAAELEKFQKEQTYDANMRTAMLNMFDGKLTLSEAERLYRNDTLKKSDYDILEGKLVKPDYQILREMEVSDPSTFNEVRQAQLEGTKSPGELSRMIAQGNVDGKITSDDAKYLDKMSKGVPPAPRDQLVASQAKALEDFGNRYFAEHVGDYLPVNVPGVSSIAVKKEQSAKDVQGLMADFYRRVDKEQADGERVGQIANEVMGTYVKKRYPEMNRLTDIPHVVVGIDGKIQRLLNPDQKTKLKGQYKVQRSTDSDSRGYMESQREFNASRGTEKNPSNMDFDGEETPP